DLVDARNVSWILLRKNANHIVSVNKHHPVHDQKNSLMGSDAQLTVLLLELSCKCLSRGPGRIYKPGLASSHKRDARNAIRFSNRPPALLEFCFIRVRPAGGYDFLGKLLDDGRKFGLSECKLLRPANDVATKI